MQYGMTIVLQRSAKKLILNINESVLEKVMSHYGITNPQNVFVFPIQNSNITPMFAKKFYDCLYACICKKDPKGLTNNYLDDMPDYLSDKSLMELINIFSRFLPDYPEMPKVDECKLCHANLPEPDGFGGVLVTYKDEQIKICFSCYQSGRHLH